MGLKGYFNKKSTSFVEETKKVMGSKTISENFDNIREDFNTLINPSNKNKTTNLTFEETIEKFNITEEMIEKNYKTNVYVFYAMASMFIILLFLFFYYLAKGNTMPMITSLFVSGVPLVKMFQSSVDCCRLKKRNFITIKEWYNTKEFIPSFNYKE